MIFISSKLSDGNMSLESGDLKAALKNRKRFFKSLCINSKNVAEVKQIHDNKVLIIEDIPNPEVKADGLITNKTDVYLMLKIADCIAIGLFDPNNHAIALIHVGWRGLEKSIIKNAVKLMQQNFHTNPKGLIVQFSPSIGPCCYRIDLWTQAENQLASCGVPKKNVDNPKICTYHTKDYFSYRRSEDQNLPDSRFVTILGLK